MSDGADFVVRDPAAGCLSCGHQGMDIFYEVRDIPVHSVVLMPTHATAVDFPRGDVLLGFCPECGFIQNTRFDAGSVDYTQRTKRHRPSPAPSTLLQRDLAERSSIDTICTARPSWKSVAARVSSSYSCVSWGTTVGSGSTPRICPVGSKATP